MALPIWTNIEALKYSGYPIRNYCMCVNCYYNLEDKYSITYKETKCPICGSDWRLIRKEDYEDIYEKKHHIKLRKEKVKKILCQ